MWRVRMAPFFVCPLRLRLSFPLGTRLLFHIVTRIYASFLSPEVASVNSTVRTLYETVTRRGWYFLLNRD